MDWRKNAYDYTIFDFNFQRRCLYRLSLRLFFLFYKRNACLYMIFLELQRPPKGHSSLLLQLQDATSDLLSFTISSFSSPLLWLFKMLFIFLVKKKLIFTVFQLKVLLNGLSLSKCLSKRCRKHLPILMLVSLLVCYSQISVLSFFLTYTALAQSEG